MSFISPTEKSCFYCNVLMDAKDQMAPNRKTRDHKIPKSRGGGDWLG